MALSQNQQALQAGLGETVTQLQNVLAQVKKTQAQFVQSGANNIAADLQAVYDAIAPVLPNLQRDLNDINDLAAAP